MARSDFHAMRELALNLSGDAALGLHGGEATTGGGHLIPYLMANSGCLRQVKWMREGARASMNDYVPIVLDMFLFGLCGPATPPADAPSTDVPGDPVNLR